MSNDKTFLRTEPFGEYSCPYCARYRHVGHAESCQITRLRSLASSLAGALRDCLREVDACIRVLAREGIIQSENVGKDKRDKFRKALAEYEAANPARPPASEPGP